MSDNDSPSGTHSERDLSAELQEAIKHFQPFLDSNPESTIEIAEHHGEQLLSIRQLWGEVGLAIYLRHDYTDISESLNNVKLPTRFTAIWHVDIRELEVIWTAFPLSKAVAEVVGRQFIFWYNSNKHECEFAKSSERLLKIAKYASPVGQSRTNHRNLFSFSIYVDRRDDSNESKKSASPMGEPLSFWIRNLDWDEDYIVGLTNHLNFYLTYYDNLSPSILIHTPDLEAPKPRTRYLIGSFPTHLHSRLIDEDLLQLWRASREGDAARRFVYYYRIIEYVSLIYIDKNVRQGVKKLLSTAHAFSDVGKLTDQVIEEAMSGNLEEGMRIVNLLVDAVDSKILWREIEKNIDSFTKETNFDGGFVLSPLCSSETNEKIFVSTGMSQFAGAVRRIRNHLSHGRDKGTLTSITPTVSNFRRLEPWVAALSVVAGEVINFKHSL